MKWTKPFAVIVLIGWFGQPTISRADLNQYTHAAKGLTFSIGRGLTLSNDELEAARTDEIALGINLVPDVLQLSVPFTSYQVDTKANADDVLPAGSIDVDTVGVALTLSLRKKWSPFVGVGAAFYNFDEQFQTAANLQNSFGAEFYGGLRFRLIESIFGLSRLHGSITYQRTLLEPGVSVPVKSDIDSLELHRHSITLALTVTGL